MRIKLNDVKVSTAKKFLEMFKTVCKADAFIDFETNEVVIV